MGAALAIVALAGCGSSGPPPVEVHPVQGRITFRGQPADGASIQLHPKTPLENVPKPRASVKHDGTFSITTFDTGDGAPAGDYVLTLTWYKLIPQGADKASGPNVIPGKYTRPETSSLVVKVAAGDNHLDPIQLK